MVNAKFVCETLEHTEGVNHRSDRVKFRAAYGTGNEEWSKHTPWGSIEMQITNPNALSQFKPGKEYKLTFEEVETEVITK